MVEVLKQDQYQPMPVEKQVLIVFAGVNGQMDDVPVPAILKFEREFVKFVEQKYSDILNEISEKKVIEDATRDKILQAVQEFKKGFSPE